MRKNNHELRSLLYCILATPQSKLIFVNQFCQLPLHRGALGAAAPVQASVVPYDFNATRSRRAIRESPLRPLICFSPAYT